MGFVWRYERNDGTVIVDLPAPATADPFPTQADAESWLGESWRDLLREGVDSVTLLSDGTEIYGPMSLHPPQ